MIEREGEGVQSELLLMALPQEALVANNRRGNAYAIY